jgi:DNA-binding transcriptional MerR regulator
MLGQSIMRGGSYRRVRASLIRYCESIGLRPNGDRVGGQRRYDGTVLWRLAVIDVAQRAGLSLDEIRGELRNSRANLRRSLPRRRRGRARETRPGCRVAAAPVVTRRPVDSRPSRRARLPRLAGGGWEEFRQELEQLFDAGDEVVAFLSTYGRGRASGVELQSQVAHVLRFKDGKCIESVTHLDRAEALRATGLG